MEDEIETKIGPEKKPFSKNIIIIIVIIFLVLTNVVTATYFFIKQKDEQAPNNNANIAVNTQPTIDDNNNTPIDETVPTTDEVLPEDKTGGTITVEWNEWPVKVKYYEVFNDQKVATKLEALSVFQRDWGTMGNYNYLNLLDIYKVGQIKSGPYEGDSLYIVFLAYQGMGIEKLGYRVIKNNNGLIYLTKYSYSYENGYEKLFDKKNNLITISNLEPQEIITIPNSRIPLERANEDAIQMADEYDNPKKLFLYNNSNYIYRDTKSNCFFVRANDGTARKYYLKFDFLGGKLEEHSYAALPYKLGILWSNGIQNSDEYIYKPGGCFFGCYNYPSYIKSVDRLVVIGAGPNGEKFYEPKDKNTIIAEGAKKGVYQTMYDEHYQFFDQAQSKEAKVSYEEFLAGHPIIYWQDPFGDFMEFRDAKFQPMAECGKPVIYLYPEKEMDVSVKVTPTGGLSISDPYYGEGWKVKAKPNGEIYNYGDGKIYPYLFWEGFGANYQTPASGFVVPRGKVAEFLETKLPQLGLKENEYKEFMAYWLPKMQEKKYYFISFMPQAEFDKLAPLEIYPQPDTVIRVFMDYFGLDEYQSVRPQIIKTPERKGFTVVEWGGTLGR